MSKSALSIIFTRIIDNLFKNTSNQLPDAAGCRCCTDTSGANVTDGLDPLDPPGAAAAAAADEL